MKYFTLIFSLSAIFLFNTCYAQSQDKQPVPIKLYAFDCGRIDVSDFANFSDTGDYNNKAAQLGDPCFLIVHPKGVLLWDTGFPDALIKKPETAGVFHLTKSTAINDNLKKIALKPNDIKFVSVSHSHIDHAGALDQFPKSTWILQNSEVTYAKTRPSPFVVNIAGLKNWKSAHKIMISGDYDVFGDGTVQILSTPGHTPGHQALMVKLPQAGTIILSGDEYHQRSSFETLRIPVFNTSRAETMASSDRIKGLLKTTNARLIIQHDDNDINGLPKFPEYLQ